MTEKSNLPHWGPIHSYNQIYFTRLEKLPWQEIWFSWIQIWFTCTRDITAGVGLSQTLNLTPLGPTQSRKHIILYNIPEYIFEIQISLLFSFSSRVNFDWFYRCREATNVKFEVSGVILRLFWSCWAHKIFFEVQKVHDLKWHLCATSSTLY